MSFEALEQVCLKWTPILSITLIVVSGPLLHQLFHTTLSTELMKEPVIFMDVSRLIASACRQSIIEASAMVGQTHFTDLVRRINSTYTLVN